MSGDEKFTEWAVRYPADWCDGGYGYQLCDDEVHARTWQEIHARPNEIVSRVVTRGPWLAAGDVDLTDQVIDTRPRCEPDRHLLVGTYHVRGGVAGMCTRCATLQVNRDALNEYHCAGCTGIVE